MVGRILTWLHDFHHLLYIHFCLVIQWNCLCLKCGLCYFLAFNFPNSQFFHLYVYLLGQCGVNKRRLALSLSFKHKCQTPWLSHGVIATPYIEQLRPGVMCRLGRGKAEPPQQTFLFFHLTSVVLLVVLLLGKAYSGITGIQWPQMSTVWEQNHGKRWRALSLSPNNAWEDANRVEWDLRERAENGRSKQSSSSSYKRLFIKHKKDREKSSKPTEITYANSLIIRWNIRTWHPQLYRKNVWLPLSRSVCIR